MGCECCISRRGPDGPDRAVEVYKLEKSEEKSTVTVDVGSPKKAGRVAPEMRAAKSSESRKEE